MFDTAECRKSLPGWRGKKDEWQTKSFDCQLDRYLIDEDGHIHFKRIKELELEKAELQEKLDAECHVIIDLNSQLMKCRRYFKMLESTGASIPEWVEELSKPPMPEAIKAWLDRYYTPGFKADSDDMNMCFWIEQTFEVPE